MCRLDFPVRPPNVTVQVLDDGAYVTCLVAWVLNPGIIISIPQMYLDILTEYRIDSLFDWLLYDDTSCQGWQGGISFYGNMKYILGYDSPDI